MAEREERATTPRPAPSVVRSRVGERSLRWARPGRFLRDLNIFALLLVIAAGAAFLLLPGSDDGLIGLPTLVVGQEAPRTIKSPRAFAIADAETTERLRDEAARRVRPIYDLLVGQGDEVKSRIEAAFAAEAATRRVDAGVAVVPEPSREFLRALEVMLEEDALLPLIRAPVPDELRDAAIMIAKMAYESRIVEDRALLRLQAPQGFVLRFIDRYGAGDREVLVEGDEGIVGIDQARARVDDLVAEHLKRLGVEQRRAVAVLVKRLIEPNVVPNRLETDARAEAARQAVKTVVIAIKPGETVLRSGERVTERHLFILHGIELELRAQSRVQAALGSALLIVLLVVVLYRLYLRALAPSQPSHRDLAFLASAYVVVLLVLWGGYKITTGLAEEYSLNAAHTSRLAIPFAAGALLVRFTLGVEFAFPFGVLSALTAGWMMGGNLDHTAYAMAGCVAAISMRRSSRPRTSLFVAGLRVALAQALIAIGLALLDSRLSLEEGAIEVALALASGLLSALIAFLFVPLVEVLFGYATDLKLADLANLNHELLRELLIEAPGTYHHSILAGSLAESAARSIGANALLAQVGAYYHDIGKIKNPRAYEENVETRFVTVSPVDAARELKTHVADGLELAIKHRLGQSVLEIIAQHHGTSFVRGPYQRELDLASPGAPPPDPADFAYPGPRPISREAAIVMLADVVEVATRDLASAIALEPSAIQAAVKRAVDEVLAAGQLERSELSLRDIQQIIHEFTSVLEDRLIRRVRPNLSGLPRLGGAKVVRPPLGGGLN